MSMYWIGGYTASGDGAASGISAVATEPDGALGDAWDVVDADSPSWLTKHPQLPMVYAALESLGQVQEFSSDGEEGLRPCGDPVPAGDVVCHLTFVPEYSALLAACYGDGKLIRYQVDAEGRIGAATVGEPGLDPYSPEQPRQSRAHSSVYLGGGRVASADLGHDTIRFWRLDADGAGSAGLLDDGAVVLPEGSGPRHLALHPDGRLFVVTEYSCEVITLSPDADPDGDAEGVAEAGGGYAVTGRVPLLDDTAADAGREPDAAAELCLSEDNSKLYAGVRSANLIVTLSVDPEPAVLSRVSCGGDWPRHHLPTTLGDRPVLLVANQRSGEIAVLPRDADGLPGESVQQVAAGSPACLLPR